MFLSTAAQTRLELFSILDFVLIHNPKNTQKLVLTSQRLPLASSFNWPNLKVMSKHSRSVHNRSQRNPIFVVEHHPHKGNVSVSSRWNGKINKFLRFLVGARRNFLLVFEAICGISSEQCSERNFYNFALELYSLELYTIGKLVEMFRRETETFIVNLIRCWINCASESFGGKWFDREIEPSRYWCWWLLI